MKLIESEVMIVGAGAAGLTAGIFAAQSGKSVTILERAPQVGRKILMSGGTRCNVLPVRVSLSDYVTDSSQNLLKKIFKTWSVAQCYDWFTQELKLPLSCEVESNKWFPTSNSAKDVRDVLVNKAHDLGARIHINSSMEKLHKENNGEWHMACKDGARGVAEKVIMATGGLSIPSTGTDGTGHRCVRRIGHSMITPYPALTPLYGAHPGGEQLPGVSLDVITQVRSQNAVPVSSHRSGFLFTHDGYSGPSILDISHHVIRPLEQGKSSLPQVSVNWASITPEAWVKALEGKLPIRTVVKKMLPNRLADALCQEYEHSDRKFAELGKKDRQHLLELLTAYPLPCTGHAGYKKAEVTGGGVPLEEINPATMESKILPNLYLCGEILDVFGRIGGFNFYWAWLSGRLAGLSV